MTEKIFYSIIYNKIGNLTPIKADCGRLCGKKCCEGDKDGDGMYLFPGEETLYNPLPAWASVSVTDFEYAKGHFAYLLSCDGVCPRSARPLSCRIFPLTPYIDRENRLSVIIDPRSGGMCPMSVLKLSDFDPEFVKAVDAVGKILIKNPQCREFLYSLSRMFDELRFLS